MAKPLHCIIDGTEYKYCPSCSDYDPEETWRLLYCCENCRNIYHIYDAYKGKDITLEEAKDRLAKECDLSNKDNFTPWAKDTLKDLISFEKKKIEKPEKIVKK